MVTLLGLSLLGCGGKSSSSGDDGGSGSTAGTGAGGSGTKPRDCQLDGQTYKSGTSFKDSDGCNTCSCEDGELACTLLGCIAGYCTYDGQTYDVGEKFTPADGSTCVCVANQTINCMVGSGDECYGLGSSYQGLLERAKSCDPQAANECTQLVAGALRCGCETFVNPNMYSRDAVAAVEKEFSANACGEGVTCGPCPPPPTRGYCTPSGQCADLQDFGGERACKVAGVIYPSGTAGIQDPFSCNQCVCENGELACDDAACPKPCPDNTKPGRGCAECGITDNCLVTEYDCMPICVETCVKGACIDGLCVSYCG